MSALAIGALSHIGWDSFTHANTIIVNSFIVYRMGVPFGTYELPLFKVLQHLSSLVGAAVIAWFAIAWFKRTVPMSPCTRSLNARARLLTLASVALAAMAGGLAGLMVGNPKSLEHGLFNFCVTGMATAAAAVLVLCVAWQVTVHREASHT